MALDNILRKARLVTAVGLSSLFALSCGPNKGNEEKGSANKDITLYAQVSKINKNRDALSDAYVSFVPPSSATYTGRMSRLLINAFDSSDSPTVHYQKVFDSLSELDISRGDVISVHFTNEPSMYNPRNPRANMDNYVSTNDIKHVSSY